VCLSVSLLSVREDISGTTHAIKFLCMLPVSVARSSLSMFTIGRIAYRWEERSGKGFSPPLKMHHRPGMGDGSAQRRRSMLSYDCLVLFVYSVVGLLVLLPEITRTHQEMR